jgi:hypothetical protein
MTPAEGGTPVVLSGGESAHLRQVLAACSQLLTWAHRHGGPAASALLAGMTRQLADDRSPERLLYDLNLAIDYLDFAPAARSDR